MSASLSRKPFRNLHDRTRDDARFLINWLRRPLVLGAVSPSSRELGRAMASYVPLGSARKVLELGPGTGVVTECLIGHGVAEENLVLVEYAAEFCAMLRARFPRATVIQGDAYRLGGMIDAALGPEGPAAVISSLPLFTKPDAERERLVGDALARLPAGHPFIQFSYALTLPVKPGRVGAVVELSPWVKRNLPPARVMVYRRAANA